MVGARGGFSIIFLHLIQLYKILLNWPSERVTIRFNKTPERVSKQFIVSQTI